MRTRNIRKRPIRSGEAWLFKNKRASALVLQGMEDAKRGRLVKARIAVTPHP